MTADFFRFLTHRTLLGWVKVFAARRQGVVAQ
jgi:hypothetical protein